MHEAADRASKVAGDLSGRRRRRLWCRGAPAPRRQNRI